MEYQAFHTLAIIALSTVMMRNPKLWFYWSDVPLAIGIELFFGSLYCLALSYLRLWVYITPIGGVCFPAGWGAAADWCAVPGNAVNNVILYCRPGFEKECVAEITEKAVERELYGFACVKENSGYVVFICY